MARLSVELQQFFFEQAPARLQAEDKPLRVTLKDILELAGERTFGFLFVILSLPSALPIPAPGYSVPFGIVLFVLAIQLIAGRERPWLPEKWRDRSFDLKQVQKVIKAGVPWLQRIETLSRPRLSYICTSRTGRTIIGSAIALMAISMMIPLPLTNTAPAMGIFITGFGLLDDDGAISLAGLTVCVMAFALSATIITAFLFGGMTLVNQVIEGIRGLKP